MKNKLSLREKIDRYFLTLEERGKLDFIFVWFLLYQLFKVAILVTFIYLIYKFAKFIITWI